MAGVSATVSFTPTLAEVFRDLRITPEQVTANNKRALTAMGAWMVREMRESVKSDGAQGQPGSGKAWKPLSDWWLGVKAEEGRPLHIGIYKGDMQKSFSFDTRMGQLEVEAGPTVEHSESFNKMRPITPEESYAAARFQDIVTDAWSK